MTTEDTGAPPSTHPPSRWRGIRAAMLPAWGRAVVTILGSLAITRAAGLGHLTGYAIVPGLGFALSTVTGPVAERALAVGAATTALAALSAFGAVVSTGTLTPALALATMGLVLGLLPSAGPRAAAVALPLLIGFAYSVGHPLVHASPGLRAATVLLSLPVYVLGTAVLFRTDQRRPLRLGAAAALDTIAGAADSLAHRRPAALTRIEAAVAEFRRAAVRTTGALAPPGSSPDAQAAQLLVVSLHRAAAAEQLAASGLGAPDAATRARLLWLARAAADCADALTHRTGSPDAAQLERLTRIPLPTRTNEGIRELAGALADIARSARTLNGEPAALRDRLIGPLPGPLSRVLAVLSLDDPAFRRSVRLAAACGTVGLVAGWSGLGRTYWAVFAVVMVLNGPAAQDRRRAVMRIAGTAVGFLLAVPLLVLVQDHANLAVAIGLVLLLPGLLLAPVNYGYSVVFLTCTAAMMMSAGGVPGDFLRFRLQENAIGAAVVITIGSLLWHTTRADWWLSARSTAQALTEAFQADDATPYHERLVTKVLALRAATAELQEVPDVFSVYGPTWTFLSAAEALVRIRSGPLAEPVPGRTSLAVRLEAVATACLPHRAEAPLPHPTGPQTSPAAEETARAERAVAALRRVEAEGR